jgi:SulP family sulfate permease
VAGHTSLPDAFPDRDRAVEWIEGQLIAEMGTEAVETPMEPASFAPRLGLTADEGSMVLGITEIRQFPAGSTVFAEGDPSNELYYLLSGRLSIYIGLDMGQGRRVVTFLPGNSFGDVAFLDGRPRTASAVCEEACAVLVISRPAVEALARTAPDLVAKVFGALALDLAGRLRHADRLLRDEMDG